MVMLSDFSQSTFPEKRRCLVSPSMQGFLSPGPKLLRERLWARVLGKSFNHLTTHEGLGYLRRPKAHHLH